MFNHLLPLKLQFFGEPGQGEPGQGGTVAGQKQTGMGGTSGQAPEFDYEKLASIVTGKQTVTEDTVLKSFFKEQGLSKDEMSQAISAFKAEKAKNTPDVSVLQTQLTQAQQMAQQAIVEKEATVEALSLGLDSKTIPYVLKLTDLSGVVGEDGKINNETLKKALNKVLEDVPQLKPSQNSNNGFQIGSGGAGNSNDATEAALKQAFGL